MKKILFLSLFFTFFLNFKANSNNNVKILVKIDNELITNFDIKNKIITKLILTNQKINQKNINNLKKISLEELIQNRLKKIELENYNFKRDNNRINSYLNSLTSNSVNDLENLFNKNNINFQTFIDEIDTEFKWRNLIYQKYSKKIEISSEEIDRELKKKIQNQKKLTEYSLSEIEILSTDIDLDTEKINEVMVEIKKSGFDSAVSKYSISSTASNKGKLGWINSSSLSQDFLIILKNMKIGEISEPIIKQDKIIFLRLDDKKISNVSEGNFGTLREKVINQKKNELFNLYSSSYLSKLRNTKFIEYKK